LLFTVMIILSVNCNRVLDLHLSVNCKRVDLRKEPNLLNADGALG